MLVTRSMISTGVRSLGVVPGDVVMFHTRSSSFGHVVGGADAVVHALLDAVQAEGTLVVTTSSDDNTYEINEWDAERRSAYLEEFPAFDPLVSSAAPDVGRLPERLRTWPGALRSAHPECSLAALGARARWVVEPHDTRVDGFGPGTPLARLVECNAAILMLGAPLETLTILHHAETVARAGPRNRVHYRMPVLVGGVRTWLDYSDINSNTGAYDYAPHVPAGMDPFEHLGRDAVAAGLSAAGSIGGATCRVFRARPLVEFAVEWLEKRFPSRADARP